MSKPLVLCVDDDSDILLYLRLVLEAGGFSVSEASSAEAGLRAYDRERPDLVVLDLMMEEVDSGMGFAKELQRKGNQAPVFLLSSVGDNLSLTIDHADLGLAGIFQKPLERERLLGVLHAALPEAAS